MSKDNVNEWGCIGSIDDSLTDLLKNGARALIQKAIEEELQAFLNPYDKVTDLEGRKTVVRNGYLPEREVLTGLGAIPVRVPKVRDRSGGGVKFNSSLVPPYVRKAKRGRSGFAVAIPTRHFDRRHAGGAVGAAGRGCQRLIAGSR